MRLDKFIIAHFDDEFKKDYIKVILKGILEYRENEKGFDINDINFHILVFIDNNLVQLDEYDIQNIIEFIINTDFNQNEFKPLILNYFKELVEGI